MESLIIALELTGYGLGGVFLSLILLYIIIRVTASAFKEKAKKTDE
jgi:Na+-transporting methylmalonyl-CoA/oxaloacetate decarboxylase gamma subunit